MRSSRLVLALIPAALGACTPMQWVKPDAGLEQVARDTDECRTSALHEAARQSWMWSAPRAPIVVRDAQGRRFTVWPAPDPFQDRFVEEARLANFCMRSKGYELRAVESAR